MRRLYLICLQERERIALLNGSLQAELSAARTQTLVLHKSLAQQEDASELVIAQQRALCRESEEKLGRSIAGTHIRRSGWLSCWLFLRVSWHALFRIDGD